MNFAPDELVGSMNTAAKFLSLVSADPVATTLAPETISPLSVSFST